ncbi:MAG: hypothetical protein E7667_02565 [Ruminococcaceae bacterium]|nr:hypothetical protein [Oscillospiraceae bacterium]
MDKAKQFPVRADIFENHHKRYGVIFYDICGKEVKRFEDVFVCREQAEIFAVKCNYAALSVEHIYDVLEDYLQ